VDIVRSHVYGVRSEQVDGAEHLARASGPVVGWSIADHLRAELMVDALQLALWRRQPPAGRAAPAARRAHRRPLRPRRPRRTHVVVATPRWWRCLFAALAVGVYIISRGLAKLGSREPYTEDRDR
jgi:hypothetical protein